MQWNPKARADSAVTFVWGPVRACPRPHCHLQTPGPSPNFPEPDPSSSSPWASPSTWASDDSDPAQPTPDSAAAHLTSSPRPALSRAHLGANPTVPTSRQRAAPPGSPLRGPLPAEQVTQWGVLFSSALPAQASHHGGQTGNSSRDGQLLTPHLTPKAQNIGTQ